MRISRRLELVSGLASGVIGLLIVGYVLFGPFYSTETGACPTGSAGTTCASTSGSASLLQRGIDPITLLYLSILSLVLLGIGASAILYSRSGRFLWQTCLWASTGLLMVGAFIGLASIGLFLLPSILLAVFACVFSSRNRHRVAG